MCNQIKMAKNSMDVLHQIQQLLNDKSVIYMKEGDHIPKIILPTEFLQSNFLQAENICTRVNINFMQPVLHRNDVLYKALKCSSTLFYPQPRSAG